MRIIAILFLAIGSNAAEFQASTFFQYPIAEGGEVKPAGGINLRSILWRGFAGGAWDSEDKEHGVEAGAGLEYRVADRLTLGTNIRWQKDDTDRHVIVPTVGVEWRF